MKTDSLKPKRPLPSRYNSAEAQKRFRAGLLRVMRDVLCEPKKKGGSHVETNR